MGKNLMEEQRALIACNSDHVHAGHRQSSITAYIEHLSAIKDKDNVDMRWPVQVMVANIINEALFIYRYKHEECHPLMKYVEDFNLMIDHLADSKGMMLGMGFPFLTKLPIIGWYTFGAFKSAMAKINEYIVDNVDRALKNYNVEDEPTCFVHAYKQRMAQKSNEYLDKDNLMGCCADFFLAGQETTTTTLRWAMLIFPSHPEIQEKLRQEVHTIVVKDRLPFMADQSKGTVIPKDTWINADIHYLMTHDPLFVNPEEFCPDRYIAEDGKTLRKDLMERTLPFSIGKRVCAGEGLFLFLGLTSTFQHFKISPRPGYPIDLHPKPAGTIILPKPQKLRIQKV